MKEERFKKISKNITELIMSYILTIIIIGMNVWVWIAKFKYIGYSYNKVDFFEIMWIQLFLLIGVGIYFIIKSHTRVEVYWIKDDAS